MPTTAKIRSRVTTRPPVDQRVHRVPRRPWVPNRARYHSWPLRRDDRGQDQRKFGAVTDQASPEDREHREGYEPAPRESRGVQHERGDPHRDHDQIESTEEGRDTVGEERKRLAELVVLAGPDQLGEAIQGDRIDAESPRVDQCGPGAKSQHQQGGRDRDRAWHRGIARRGTLLFPDILGGLIDLAFGPREGASVKPVPQDDRGEHGQAGEKGDVPVGPQDEQGYQPPEVSRSALIECPERNQELERQEEQAPR